jgi:NADH:ubiquinone oxidoreductase subunit 6 (subunit J)
MKNSTLIRGTFMLLFSLVLTYCKISKEITLKEMSLGVLLQIALTLVFLAIVIVVFYLGKMNRNRNFNSFNNKMQNGK